MNNILCKELIPQRYLKNIVMDIVITTFLAITT